MNDNVIQIKKTNALPVYRMEFGPDGELIKQEKLGVAFAKPNSSTLRLKLWLLPDNQIFIVPTDADPSKHLVLSLDTYASPTGELKKNWNPIGFGEIVDNHIKLNVHLLAEHIYVSLLPEKSNQQAAHVA